MHRVACALEKMKLDIAVAGNGFRAVDSRDQRAVDRIGGKKQQGNRHAEHHRPRVPRRGVGHRSVRHFRPTLEQRLHFEFNISRVPIRVFGADRRDGWMRRGLGELSQEVRRYLRVKSWIFEYNPCGEMIISWAFELTQV